MLQISLIIPETKSESIQQNILISSLISTWVLSYGGGGGVPGVGGGGGAARRSTLGPPGLPLGGW